MVESRSKGRGGARRGDGRSAGELRRIRFTPGFLPPAEGSVLVEAGNTRVICTATIQESVPPFLRGRGRGWVTAEYAMLPRSSGERIERERRGPGGRTQEIQRLIGRSLRAAVDMDALGERSILIDCDVIQADGGTRTASITGGFVALALALDRLRAAGALGRLPLTRTIAAVSAGLVDRKVPGGLRGGLACRRRPEHRPDGAGQVVEITGTAEGAVHAWPPVASDCLAGVRRRSAADQSRGNAPRRDDPPRVVLATENPGKGVS